MGTTREKKAGEALNNMAENSDTRNMWRTVRRICMWILGLKWLSY